MKLFIYARRALFRARGLDAHKLRGRARLLIHVSLFHARAMSQL